MYCIHLHTWNVCVLFFFNCLSRNVHRTNTCIPGERKREKHIHTQTSDNNENTVTLLKAPSTYFKIILSLSFHLIHHARCIAIVGLCMFDRRVCTIQRPNDNIEDFVVFLFCFTSLLMLPLLPRFLLFLFLHYVFISSSLVQSIYTQGFAYKFFCKMNEPNERMTKRENNNFMNFIFFQAT